MIIEKYINLDKYQDFYHGGLMTYSQYELEKIKAFVDYQVFIEIGIPKKILGSYEAIDKLMFTEQHLIFGKMTYVDNNFLVIDKSQSVLLFERNENQSFLYNSSFSQFIACVYEFDKFLKNSIQSEAFGEFYSNRKRYVDVIRDKLTQIDSSIDSSLWIDYLDEMENGAW
ncbi:SUKH-4 family immunity protein [bacterium SCSIO 12741]|nr:SUKH-4 family immunity protein [bacterium SCSIO 12741]